MRSQEDSIDFKISTQLINIDLFQFEIFEFNSIKLVLKTNLILFISIWKICEDNYKL